MRSSRLLIGLLAVFSVVFFLACSDDDCGKTDCNENTTLQNVTFRGTSDGTEYVLKITQKAARSLRSTYQPQVGDSYVLTINGNTSSGIVESIGQNGILTLKPNSEQATVFTVQTSTNGLESITGTIRLDNGTTVQASGELEPKGSESGKENGNTGNGADDTPNIPTNHPIIGTWEWVSEWERKDVYVFRQDGTGEYRICWGDGVEGGAYMRYAINGNLITLFYAEIDDYSINGNTLTVFGGEWTRVGSGSGIVGTWKQTRDNEGELVEVQLEFRQNGTATYTSYSGSDEHTYTISGNKLSLFFEAANFTYTSGNSFTIGCVDGESPSKIFTRIGS